MLRTNEIFIARNEYCVSLGQNITISETLNDSFIEYCECRYENIVDRDLVAKCICDCYTNGTVCPNIKNGRCYVSVLLTDPENY